MYLAPNLVTVRIIGGAQKCISEPRHTFGRFYFLLFLISGHTGELLNKVKFEHLAADLVSEVG